MGLGHFSALAAAILAALGSVIIRKIGNDERAVVMLLANLMVTLVLMGVLLIWNYEPMPLADLGMLILVAAFSLLGLVASIAAYRLAQAAIVAPMQYSQIIWATIFGYLWFDERIETNTVVGAAIIIGSGIYLVWRETMSGNSRHQPITSSRDQRPALSFRPRVGDFFRIHKTKK